MLWGLLDLGISTGQIKDAGYFLDVNSGYFIAEADAADALQAAISTCPYIEYDMIAAVVPYEEGKKIFREDTKARVEATKQ